MSKKENFLKWLAIYTEGKKKTKYWLAHKAILTLSLESILKKRMKAGRLTIDLMCL